MNMNLKFPYQFDHRGYTAETGDDNHIRDMIEQVLFTSPGERVNRPSFGSGLQQLVFEPNSSELASTLRFLVQSALQQWLGNLIRVDGVEVSNEDAALMVKVIYTVLKTNQSQTAQFTK